MRVDAFAVYREAMMVGSKKAVALADDTLLLPDYDIKRHSINVRHARLRARV